MNEGIVSPTIFLPSPIPVSISLRPLDLLPPYRLPLAPGGYCAWSGAARRGGWVARWASAAAGRVGLVTGRVAGNSGIEGLLGRKKDRQNQRLHRLSCALKPASNTAHQMHTQHTHRRHRPALSVYPSVCPSLPLCVSVGVPLLADT